MNLTHPKLRFSRNCLRFSFRNLSSERSISFFSWIVLERTSLFRAATSVRSVIGLHNWILQWEIYNNYLPFSAVTTEILQAGALVAMVDLPLVKCVSISDSTVPSPANSEPLWKVPQFQLNQGGFFISFCKFRLLPASGGCCAKSSAWFWRAAMCLILTGLTTDATSWTRMRGKTFVSILEREQVLKDLILAHQMEGKPTAQIHKPGNWEWPQYLSIQKEKIMSGICTID